MGYAVFLLSCFILTTLSVDPTEFDTVGPSTDAPEGKPRA